MSTSESIRTSRAASANRRDFLKNAGRVATVGALAGAVVPRVHAAEDNTIRIALIGTGGRGTGAAANALSVPNEPLKLVAVADVFQHRLDGGLANLKNQFGDKVDVPDERKFLGFDAYKQAIDCLKPGDIAIMATPPAFRWPHFTYAIEKGVHVFMEKAVTVDGPSTRRMLELGKKSVEKNLKVGVGLMCRHCEARHELLKRIQDGEIGDIITLRAYRMHGPPASAFLMPRPADDANELLWQVARFHGFLWASGGFYSDFFIHNIDECCWMKGKWPVSAQATGGRHYRGEYVDQNFDSYSVEYTFDDGTKFLMYGRGIGGCFDSFSSIAHGSKGVATISSAGHSPARCCTYKGHNMTRDNLIWSATKEPNPYQLEWNNLVDAIRNDKPHNEVQRGAEASLVTAMGRIAAHTGQLVTYDQALHWDFELGPDVDKLTMESTPPVVANAEGKYPVPMPGILRNREFQA
jgi:predicted dehydrogenase